MFYGWLIYVFASVLVIGVDFNLLNSKENCNETDQVMCNGIGCVYASSLLNEYVEQ